MNRRLLHSCLLLAALAVAPSARAATPPPSAEDMKELDALQSAIVSYESASKEYRSTVTRAIKQDYDRKRKALSAKYEGQIKAIEEQEKQRRIEAVALFEKFLEKYPHDRRWTPDVIFRLAELYFERASDEYLAAVDAAQKSAQPNPPSPDYQRTIDLYVRLLKEFPDYRLIDGAHYLLGYCLGEMTKEAEARQAFLGLVCQNSYKALDAPPPPQPSKGKGSAAAFVDPYVDCKPIKADSRFNPEAWTRIGEFHFDYNELELAIAAYARVLQYKDSPYYDKALYKLAWSYYRADKYPEGIKKFDELVVFSDLKKGETGKEGSDLRQEAIQYLGISFAEKDWNGDTVDDTETGLQRIQAFYQGREAEPHVREVYQKLGDIYFDQTEYLKAIELYKSLLGKWPFAPDNPKVQDRIVLALERMRNFEEALKEREVLAREYGDKNKDWYKKNRDNSEAIATAAELAETALVKYAVDHHKAAQGFKKLALATTPPDGKKLEQASKEYALAADGYARYLERYPASKNTYEYTYFYAEALYYAQRFLESAETYEKVRDSNLDNKYLEDAAFNAIKAYENLVDGLVKNNRIQIPSIPSVDKVKPPVQVMQVPGELRKLQAAYDAYVLRAPASPRLPTMTYKAAEIDFRHLDFDKARPRFQEIIEKFCGDAVSAEAGRAVLTSFSIEQNLEKIVEWTGKLQSSKCGGGKVVVKEGELKQLEGDAKFQLAQKLYDSGKFEEAAEAFVRIVDGNSTNIGGNNDKALNNAAVGFEKVNRFGAATKIYERIVNEYPASPFVDDALFRTAVNYQRFFEFDKAVVSYKRLATDPKYATSTHRTDSLFNAAVILENDQAYDEAARLFLQYSLDPKIKREDQSDAHFRAGAIYLKNKDAKKTIATFKDYLTKFGTTDPKKAIEAQFRVAEAFELQKDKAGALAQYKKVAALGSTVPAASDAAEYPAKAAFILVEQELPNLEKLKITADKNFQATEKRFKDEIARITTEYNNVIAYRRVTWTLAAYFRIGYVYELLSKALANLLTQGCPPDILKKFKQEGCDLYLEQLQKQIEPKVAGVDEEVVKRYRTTLEQAAKFGVSNDWTRLARQKANAYKPDEFPMIKDERVDFQMESPQ